MKGPTEGPTDLTDGGKKGKTDRWTKMDWRAYRGGRMDGRTDGWTNAMSGRTGELDVGYIMARAKKI